MSGGQPLFDPPLVYVTVFQASSFWGSFSGSPHLPSHLPQSGGRPLVVALLSRVGAPSTQQVRGDILATGAVEHRPRAADRQRHLWSAILGV